jgi:hypothetical protein
MSIQTDHYPNDVELRAKATSAPNAEQRRSTPALPEPFEDEQVRQPRLVAFFERLR